MERNPSEADAKERTFFAESARAYDDIMAGTAPEHTLALSLLAALTGHFGFTSILDVGAGTGRAQRYLQSRCPGCRILGVEPVKEMREVAYTQGVRREDLLDGDAYHLAFEDASFDLVTEFGVLHHVAEPRRMLAEMLRVARQGIFISDSNCFGQGGVGVRWVKQMLFHAGLWPLATRIRTKGKGYLEGADGIWYPYSVFLDRAFLKSRCRRVVVIDTTEGWKGIGRRDVGCDPLGTAKNVAVLALK